MIGRQSELNLRNSIAAPHLRSTYMAQYGDANLKEDDISVSSNNPTKMEKTFTVYKSTPDLTSLWFSVANIFLVQKT